ncbi:MAG: hypothetical protein IK065_03915 [Neisseriaceae bacterium]|nr:hypothetical protein [Neisseriaceae bacterium]
MINWNKLPIHKKFTIVFAMQNTSLFLAWWFLGANFGYLIASSLLLFVLFYTQGDRWTKKGFFIFSAVFVWMWFLDNSMGLRIHTDVNYNQLKSYSGTTVGRESNGRGGAAMLHDEMILKKYKDEKRGFFICGIKSISSCDEELKNYFDGMYNQNISVKYYTFSDTHAFIYIIPFFTNSNVVYEMKHNDKVIYDYNYFVSKYHKQQRDLIIFAIYLIVNTLVFCIFYHLIQKNSVQHTQ